MALGFPPNPTNGQIFESEPGIFYRYAAVQNAWIRIDGIRNLDLATPLRDGLMSSADFIKIEGLIIPPPQATMKADTCNIIYGTGRVGLYSTNDSLDISPTLEVINRVAGKLIGDERMWHIHNNTYGYSFSLNVDQLIEELESRGSISYGGTPGKKGKRGAKGADGADRLETGPEGFLGEDGINAEFLGVLQQEEANFETTTAGKNRAIVDLGVERVSEEENYIVATRANIGSSDACPDKVKPININSPWLVVIDDDINKVTRRLVKRNESDCTIACEICSSTLYHLNIDPILSDIEQRFRTVAAHRKARKEAIVTKWVQVMIQAFNEQKWAICCALENCRSRYRNERTRQYLETQRIQAAQADFSLIVDGMDDRVVIDMDPDKDCAVDGGTATVSSDDDCVGCHLEITLDPSANSGIEDDAFVAELPAGEYIAQVTECCPFFYVRGEYRLDNLNIGYRRQVTFDPNRDIMPLPPQDDIVRFPNLGTFEDNEAARLAYNFQTIAFIHAGGSIRLWFTDDNAADNGGTVKICIRPARCYEEEGTGGTGPVGFDCSMFFAHIDWYERGWRIGACCGADLEIDGTRYLVVRRSIGADVTCGGGESETTDCVSEFAANVRYLWGASNDDGKLPEKTFLRVELEGFWQDGDLLYCTYNSIDRQVYIYREPSRATLIGTFMTIFATPEGPVPAGEVFVSGLLEGVVVVNKVIPSTESFDFDFIVARHSGHPAIAWPTTNGEEFLTKPTSGYVGFVRDEEMSNAIIDKLIAGDVNAAKGDPATNIPFVIFAAL